MHLRQRLCGRRARLRPRPNVADADRARFVLGLSVGTASFVSRTTSARSPAEGPRRHRHLQPDRGDLGILLAYMVDFPARAANNWRWMLGVAAVPGPVLAISMLTVPHTPRWLMSKGKRDQAPRLLEAPGRRRRHRPGARGHRGGRPQARKTPSATCSPPKIRPLLLVGLGAGRLPAVRRRQHRHLLRADDPQVHRPNRLSRHPDGLRRRHQRGLHGRRGAAARQGRPAQAAAHRPVAADRRAGGARRRTSGPAPCSRTPPTSPWSALLLYIVCSRSAWARCSG